MKLSTALEQVSLRTTATASDAGALHQVISQSRSHLTAHEDYEDLADMDEAALRAQLLAGPNGIPAVSSFVMLLGPEMTGLASLIHHKPDVVGLGY